MEELEKLDDKKIVVNLKEGQNAVTILEGQAPKQLDELEKNFIAGKTEKENIQNRLSELKSRFKFSSGKEAEQDGA